MGFEGSSTAVAFVQREDPNTRLDEVLAYLRFSYRPESKFAGTAVFDIPASDVSPAYVFYIRCHPQRPTETGMGLPADGKVSIYSYMSRDDFFYLYSGLAGPGAVTTMVMTGRIKVQVRGMVGCV